MVRRGKPRSGKAAVFADGGFSVLEHNAGTTVA